MTRSFHTDLEREVLLLAFIFRLFLQFLGCSRRRLRRLPSETKHILSVTTLSRELPVSSVIVVQVHKRYIYMQELFTCFLRLFVVFLLPQVSLLPPSTSAAFPPLVSSYKQLQNVCFRAAFLEQCICTLLIVSLFETFWFDIVLRSGEGAGCNEFR